MISRHNLWVSILFSGGLLLLTIGILPLLIGQHYTMQDSNTVTIYQNGSAQLVRSDKLKTALLAESTQLFTEATDGILLGITDSTLSEIRHSVLTVEIINAKSVNLRNAPVLHSDVTIDRLMISLESPYRGWVLYGNGHYSSGPLLIVNPKQLDAIRQLITQLDAPRSH